MKLGERIIIAGLFVQITFFSFFMIIASAFDLKLQKYPMPRSCLPDIPWRKHLNVLYITSLLIMVRSVFRLTEYLQGNDGYLLHHEIFLYLLDAALMFMTSLIFNICHPSEIGRLLVIEREYELKNDYNGDGHMQH